MLLTWGLSCQLSRSVMSDSLRPHGLQHTRLPCSSPTPRVYPNSYPLSWWCHPIISSSVILFSSHLQYFPASGAFPMSQFFTSGGQSIGVSASASVLPMNIQDWFPLRWTSCISLQSKGLSRVFSSTTVGLYIFLKLPVCVCVCVLALQSWATLCNPMDHSLPVSSVHGILQARILEWISVPSSRGSSWPRDQTFLSYDLCTGK